MSKPDSQLSLRVYYEDTDAGGMVYHASYLKFAERARTEWLRGMGYDHQTLRAEHNLLFVVRHLAIDYRVAARLDDPLAVDVVVLEFGAASVMMRQTIRNHEKTILAVLDVKLATITPDGKVIRMPKDLREALKNGSGESGMPS